MPNNKKPDIQRLIEFQKLMLEFRTVKRVVNIPGTDEKENDVEHSFSLAMAAWFLLDHFPLLDKDRSIRLALVHDFVEVHAGDTFAYGKVRELASKKDRETAALLQLKKEWPDFKELTETIEEYEHQKSNEAQFVYALDKIMPAIVNFLDGGRVWQNHNITLQKLREEKEKKIPVTSEIFNYYQQLLEIFEQNLELFPVGKKV